MKEKVEKVWSTDKTLGGMEESAGAVIWRCSVVDKVFLKLVRNSQENHGIIPPWIMGWGNLMKPTGFFEVASIFLK